MCRLWSAYCLVILQRLSTRADDTSPDMLTDLQLVGDVTPQHVVHPFVSDQRELVHIYRKTNCNRLNY